ncbi:MAG TPA: type II secretion system protein GspK [Stellaceae bacterium]|nr:type II secretion system protein GspK [Stellaceae bacterium]
MPRMGDPGERSGSRPREQGFVLIAAIWFVALTAAVAVIITGWMHRSLDLAGKLQHRLAAHIAAFDAQNQIEYRLVSGFFSVRGLELPHGDERQAALAPEAVFGYKLSAGSPYVALDDRPYRLGKAVVRLQDDRGLYPLNFPSPYRLGALLRADGISYNDRDVLIDRLRDYIDDSPLHRLNGATASDYTAAGRPLPRAAPLLTPWEALRVLSWNQYPALWRTPDPLPDLTTIADTAQINLNTAPAAILATMPGIDEAAAERVIAFRHRFPIETELDLDEAVGYPVGIDPMALMYFPASSLEVAITVPDDPATLRLHLRRVFDGNAPLRVDYAVARPPADDSRLSVAALAKLPDFPEIAFPLPSDPIAGPGTAVTAR